MTVQTRDVNPASTKSLDQYAPTPVMRDEHAEATLTRLIEHQTAKLPSYFFLFGAFAAMAASARPRGSVATRAPADSSGCGRRPS
jgi:hypothetical protein